MECLICSPAALNRVDADEHESQPPHAARHAAAALGAVLGLLVIVLKASLHWDLNIRQILREMPV